MNKKIKKLNRMISCFLFLALSSSFAVAGEDKTGEEKGLMPRIGVEDGINPASLTGLNMNDVFASHLGFEECAFINLPLGTTFASQPKLVYEHRDGSFDGNPYQLDYREVPVLFDIALGMPTFNLGILMGVSIDGRVSFQGVNGSGNTKGIQLAKLN